MVGSMYCGIENNIMDGRSIIYFLIKSHHEIGYPIYNPVYIVPA